MRPFKRTFLAACLIAMSAGAYAQQRSCGAMDVLETQIAKDPKRAERLREIDEHAHAYEAELLANPNAKTGVAVTIPVVFHVLYNNSTENISDTRLQEQLAVLNEDFRKLNADRTLVPTAWQGVAADCEINFCLATKDPNGNPTTGITRTSTTVTTFSTNDAMKYSSSGGKDIWDRNKYLNIWVCDLGSSLLGYAQFPGGAAATDGVVLHYAYTGKTGASAPFNKGRTGTHEVGHWLNLYHIWGDDNGACTGSDQVTDTPNQANSSSGCPSGTRTDACTASSPGIMWMNYMDYTDDACMYMFTAGQKARVQALFATGGARASLLTSTACSGSTTPSYCASAGQSVADEWIASVAFGPISNTSGANGGYGNFTGTSYSVSKGTTYNFTLTPGFTGSTYPEYWKIWIDYNLDMDFDDAGELVYDAGATATTARTGTVTIPSTASTGAARMRVSMKYNAAQTACETFSYGEVEDYTLNIGAAASCAIPTGLASSSVTSSSATISWASTGATSYNIRYKKTSLTTWSATTSTTTSKSLTGLSSATTYEYQIQSVCSGTTSSYSTSGTFTTTASTTCTDSYEANESLSAAKVISPNTAISAKICTTTDKDWFKVTTTSTNPKLKVTLSALAADYDIRLYNSAGTQLGISQNSGTTAESIIYNGSAAATYYIQVYGYNGANSGTAYSLLAATRSTNYRLANPDAEDAFGSEEAFTNVDVFPNPASDKFTVRFEAPAAGTVAIQVIDMFGKVAIARDVNVEAGESSIGFDVADLSKGLYMVRLEMNGTILNRRIDVIR